MFQDQESGVLEKLATEFNYKQFVESLDAFTWSIDTSYSFSFASQKSLELLEYEPNSLIGSSFLDVIAIGDRQNFQQKIKDAVGHNQTSISISHNLQRHSGEIVSCQSELTLIYSSSAEFSAINGLTRITHCNIQSASLSEKLMNHQDVIDIMPIPVFYKDLSNTVINCNDALCNFLGSSREDIIGKNTSELVNYSDEEIEQVKLEHERMINGEVDRYDNIERRFTDHYGNSHRVIHSKVLLRDRENQPEATIIAFVDQTKHHNLESKLWEELNFNMLILETAESLIMVMDNERNIMRFNSACETTSGYMLTDVIGSRFEDHFTLEDNKESVVDLLDVSEEMLAERAVELSYFAKDGAKRIVSWSFASIQEDSSSPCILAVGTDITDQKKAEKNAFDRQKMLVQADKLTSLGTLVAGVAHEVNNPNNFIMFNAPQLEDIWEQLEPVIKELYGTLPERVDDMDFDELNEFVHELFNGINQGSSRIKQIVKNLKNYIQDKPVDMTAPVSVGDVIDGAMLLLGNPIRKATSNFSVSVQENIPAIHGDIGMIEQVLINLVQNACHALPDTNCALTVQAFHDTENNKVVVSVEDKGKGIPKEAMKFVTDPFFTTKRDTGGTGLGLSISNNIMKDHGGELLFDSTVGEGTIAKMVFPVVEW